MTTTSAAAVSARRARIEQLTREGYSASEIAAFLGVTKRTVVRIRRKLGITKPPAGLPLSAEELRIAAEMLADGCSYTETARTLGRGVHTMIRRFPGYGWDRQQSAAYSVAVRRLNAVSA